MLVLVNGQFVPEDQAVVSVLDRGFLYGDGLFETMRVYSGRPFRWAQHLDRLQRGADYLKIPLPFPAAALREFASQLTQRNNMPEAILRLTLSRGVGVRGYSPEGAARPTLVMTLHPAPVFDPQNPPKWKLITSSFRLPVNEPLARFKTCNKLPQILARAEANAAGADEALQLTAEGHVVEGSSGNLFWIENNSVCTPPLTSGILPGVTRAVVLEICQSLRLPLLEMNTSAEQLREVRGVFLSLSSWGIVEAVSLDDRALRRSSVVQSIRDRYRAKVREECGPA